MSVPYEQGQQEASFANSDALIPTQAFIDAIAKIPLPKVDVHIDCLVPKQAALRTEASSVKRAKELGFINTVLLSFHAGMFFGLAAAFYGVVMVGTTHYGLQRMAAGFAYATGLSMVAICGGELFTGNLMMLMAWMTKRITTVQMLWNWVVVLVGNLGGALCMAILQTWGRTHENSANGVGKAMLDIAEEKCARQFGSCVAQAILSALMVCWSCWIVTVGITGQDKQLCLLLPMACMAALGWEHIVSNFYFIPVALMIENYAFPKFWSSLSGVAITGLTSRVIDQYQIMTWPHVTIPNMIIYNFIPSVIGNMIGAFAFISLIYWYLFLRDENHESRIEFFVGSTPFFASPPSGVKPKPKRDSAPAKSVPYEPPVVQQQPPPPQPVYQPMMVAQPATAAPAIAYTPAGNTFAYPTPTATPELFRA